jgi:hypothetical protein
VRNGSHPGTGAEPRPRLSIICTGRNDDRAPDQFERLVSLQRTLAHALKNVPFEFLFVEWNPDPGRPYLGEALILDQARHYVVTREAHKRLIADAQMSTRDGKAVKGERAFLLNHANNVGLKFARGEWVLITNLDDLFPPEFGALFETGECAARALGVHPRWSYRLLVRYRRAQRSAVWRACKISLRDTRRLISRVFWPLRACRRFMRRSSYAVRVRLVPAKRVVRRVASRLRAAARAVVIRLFGGTAEKRDRPRPRWAVLLRSAIRVVRGIGTVIFGLLTAPLHASRALLTVGHPLRRRGRIVAKFVYNLAFSPRVDWRVGRVQLTPGTLYRVRRLHVSDTFARRGAAAPFIEQYIADVRAEAVDGPWNNHFPWTFACGDFLLMDLATWKRIGGFPQQIGQLHADSVTIFRIVAEGCHVALLDWNIYHMDHEDRFDAVPYVEYDFENVHRYFGPGWTQAQATLIARNGHGLRWEERPAAPEPVLTGTGQPVASGKE